MANSVTFMAHTSTLASKSGLCFHMYSMISMEYINNGILQKFACCTKYSIIDNVRYVVNGHTMIR